MGALSGLRRPGCARAHAGPPGQPQWGLCPSPALVPAAAAFSAPNRWRGLLPWLLLSVLAHALWLAPSTHEVRRPPLAPALSFQARVLPPRPLAPPGTTPRPALPRPAAPQRGAQPDRPARSSTPAVVPVGLAASTPSGASEPSFPTPEIPAHAMASARGVEPLPTHPLPPSGRWRYALQWQGETGEAWVDWQVQDGRYQLSLVRQAGRRELPQWHSEGLIGSEGLQPLQFRAGRPGKGLTGWRFDPESGLLHTARGRSQPAPRGTQDRLSWMWQLAAQAAAQQALEPLRPGSRWTLPVAGWNGELHRWTMEVEVDAEHPHWLRLRRLLPEGGLLEQRLWLDPARAYLPVRMRLRFDEAERWGLDLVEDAAPPVGPSPPPGPSNRVNRDKAASSVP